MTQVVDAEPLAEAAAWSAVTPTVAREVFNVADGDPNRWSRIWTAYTDDFTAFAGGPRQIPISSLVSGLAPAWRAMAAV
jgi:hypothetical protein